MGEHGVADDEHVLLFGELLGDGAAGGERGGAAAAVLRQAVDARVVAGRLLAGVVLEALGADAIEGEGDVEDLLLAVEAVERAAGLRGGLGEGVEEGQHGLLVLARAEHVAELHDHEVAAGPVAGVVDRPGGLEGGVGGREVAAESADRDDAALRRRHEDLLGGPRTHPRLGVGLGGVLGLDRLDLGLGLLGVLLVSAAATGESGGERDHEREEGAGAHGRMIQA